MPRDRQRTRFYRFEKQAAREFDDYPYLKLPLAECEEVLKVALNQLPYEIRDGRGRRTAAHWFTDGIHVIYLPRFSRRPWIVLHEAAHALTNGSEPHGPIFAATAINLWSRLLSWPQNRLLDLARVHKVTVAALHFQDIEKGQSVDVDEEMNLHASHADGVDLEPPVPSAINKCKRGDVKEGSKK